MATTQPRSEKAPNHASKQRPVFSRKYFPVQVAVFEYENEGRLNHSVSLTRTFRRDQESEWESTSYLTTADLLPAAKLLSESFSFIQQRLQRAHDVARSASGGPEDPAALHDDTPF